MHLGNLNQDHEGLEQPRTIQSTAVPKQSGNCANASLCHQPDGPASKESSEVKREYVEILDSE